jgi:hypothetical protein
MATENEAKFAKYLAYKERWKTESIDFPVIEEFISAPELADLHEEQTAALQKENKRLREALKYVDKACLCERFPTRKMKKGFDYHEQHPRMGECSGGSRWLTPRDKAKQALGGEDGK